MFFCPQYTITIKPCIEMAKSPIKGYVKCLMWIKLAKKLGLFSISFIEIFVSLFPTLSSQSHHIGQIQYIKDNKKAVF